MRASALSHAGGRRSDNEDSVLADAQTGLLVVADGMGGHAAGEVASAVAVDTIRADIADPSRWEHGLAAGPADLEASLTDAIGHADRAIRALAADVPRLKGMGTTVVAAVVRNRSVVVAHVGDSRAYLLHDGTLLRLTEDHTLVADMIRAGQITARQARTNRLRNVLTRSVGNGRRALSVDVRRVAWAPSDRLLLCSDGLPAAVADHRIRSILVRAGPDLGAACRQLVAAANAAGGSDNVSVIVASPGEEIDARSSA